MLFTGNFIKSCLNWFNDVNTTHVNPTTEELLFGSYNKKSTVDKLFNYTLLFMRRYIYTRKLNEDALLLPDFINKIMYRCSFEKFLLSKKTMPLLLNINVVPFQLLFL